MKQLRKSRWLLAAILLLLSLFYFHTVSISTVHAAPSTNCERKVDQEGCKKAVAACDSASADRQSDCQAAAAQKFDDVIDACKDKKRPQACNEKVNDKCKGKSGEAKQDCTKNTANDFEDRISGSTSSFFGSSTGKYKCGGKNTNVVTTKINFGCLGPDKAPPNLNPIMDLLYSIMRFLMAGVGIIIVAAIIMAGIQYSSSEGSPEATQDAKNKIRNAFIGLIVYIFTYSLMQFLVPGGLFR